MRQNEFRRCGRSHKLHLDLHHGAFGSLGKATTAVRGKKCDQANQDAETWGARAHRYIDRKNRPKTVKYWLMTPLAIGSAP